MSVSIRFRLGLVSPRFAILLVLGAGIFGPVVQPAHCQTLRLLGNVSGFGPQLGEALTQFALDTGVKVEAISVGWDQLVERTLVMVAGGAPPDVIYGISDTMKTLAEAGALASLNRFAERDHVELGMYPPTVTDYLSAHGELLALPTATSPMATYVNNDLFAEAGLVRPDAAWEAETWSWSDFLASARKLTLDLNADGKVDQWGVRNFPVFEMLGIYGLQWVNPERTEFLGARPAQVSAAEQLFAPWTSTPVVGPDTSFVQGTSGMALIASYILNSLAAAGNLIDFSIAPTPKVVRRATFASIHNLSVVNSSLNKDAAWRLVRYLAYDPDGNALFSAAENRLPVLQKSAMRFVQRWKTSFPNSRTEVLLGTYPFMWHFKLIDGRNGRQIANLLTVWNGPQLRIKNKDASVQAVMTEVTPAINALLAK